VNLSSLHLNTPRTQKGGAEKMRDFLTVGSGGVSRNRTWTQSPEMAGRQRPQAAACRFIQNFPNFVLRGGSGAQAVTDKNYDRSKHVDVCSLKN
jgi:hypothetical protein